MSSLHDLRYHYIMSYIRSSYPRDNICPAISEILGLIHSITESVVVIVLVNESLMSSKFLTSIFIHITRPVGASYFLYVMFFTHANALLCSVSTVEYLGCVLSSTSAFSEKISHISVSRDTSVHS